MAIDRAASEGYRVAADAYDRGRPGYPPEAVERLVAELQINDTSRVVDIGAGTGRLTALMEAHTSHLLAVEPVASMRQKFRALYPGLPIISGVAEQLPLLDESADVILCAQAFHWFDASRALAECARVLKPGGGLGLVWNVRDESCDWVEQLTEIIDPYAGKTPRFRSGRWREAFAQTDLFTPLQQASTPHLHRGAPDIVIDRITSISFIAALPEPQRQSVVAAVTHLIKKHPELTGKAEVAFPYEAIIYWCHKR